VGTSRAARIESAPGFAVPFVQTEHPDPTALKPFQGDGERITVAFSTWFRQKLAKSAADAA
jgi:hypothetical protein